MLCTDNFMAAFLYHNFQFFSDIIKTWLRYASKKTCEARTAKGSLYNGKKICSQKSVLAKLLLLAPAMNAISERSCSTLRTKIYLRSTMTHCMMLNTYKEALGELSLVEVANEFCRKNEARLNKF